MNPLYVIAFLDGSLGHEKQTRGILNALTELTSIEVEYKKIPPPSIKFALINWFNYIKSFFGAPYQKKQDCMIDLIIGTGSRTHLPMLLLKRECNAKVVTCMTPDFPFRRAIDLCFTPQHDRPQVHDNIFLTVGPPSTAVFKGEHDKKRGLILAGGIDNKSHQWHSDVFMAQVRSIIEKQLVIKWTISSSPRTPADTVQLLEGFASQNTNVTFFRSEDTPDGWIERAYAGNYTVWVTADSVSMVYEALTAGCSVGILPVDWKKKSDKFQISISYLLEKKMVTNYQAWLAGKNEIKIGTPLNEASRSAKEILTRWWPDRLK